MVLAHVGAVLVLSLVVLVAAAKDVAEAVAKTEKLDELDKRKKGGGGGIEGSADRHKTNENVDCELNEIAWLAARVRLPEQWSLQWLSLLSHLIELLEASEFELRRRLRTERIRL